MYLYTYRIIIALLVLILFHLLTEGATNNEDLPEFHWTNCPAVEGDQYDKCLRVDFPDQNDDIALLNQVNGEDTIFHGILNKEPHVQASVTVRGNMLEVGINKR